MKIGLIARADKTGLGVQTSEFYHHMNPDKILVVDLSHCSGQKPDMSMYPNGQIWFDKRYPGVEIFPDPVVDEFLEGLDLVFTCETPYSYYLYVKAREMGIKTVQQYNFEFLDYLYFNHLPFPDLLAAPSLWNIDRVKELPTRVEFLPVPVNRQKLPFRQRTGLKSILHTAGTPALEDRNGTYILAAAMNMVKSDVHLEIKSQKGLAIESNSRITINYEAPANYADLYGDHDAYVMPRKFGGLCLPINEAISCGMPVIASNVSPQTSWLPPDLLVDGHVSKQVMTKTMIDIFETSAVELAKRIDYFAENPEHFARMSTRMDEIASELAWDNMRDKYIKTFESLF